MARLCSNCGYAYNPDNASYCDMCNRALQTTTLAVPPASSVSVSSGAVTPPALPGRIPGQSGGPTGIAGSTTGNPPAPLETQATREASNALIGRITHLERYDERPPGDIYRTLSRLMIGILIAIPYAFFFIALGILSFFFGLLGFRSLSQLFNPIIWTSSIFRIMEVLMLRNLRGSDTLPVYRGTIEDSTGTEQHFMMNGPLVGGNLIVGSRVSMAGNWHNGTLHAVQGEDISARTTIMTSNRNPWRVIFLALLGVYGTLGIYALWYYMRAVPV